MFDLLLTPAALLHGIALFGLWFWISRLWDLPRKDAPFFVLLMVWVTLVFAGHLAGIGENLGSLAVYVPVSFLAAGVACVVYRPLALAAPGSPLLAPPALDFAPILDPKARKFLFWFLAGTLILFAVASFVLGMSVYPDNADSMIYRLPRAFFYVSKGSFLHPFDTPDKRLVFYPLDGVALYVPFVLYGLPGTFHSLPSFIAWGTIVYASYRFARELGAEKLIALLAAWLIGLTPSILAQATSTNDEILAAGLMLVCFYMVWRWLVSGRPLYFLLAGTALGLSAGTKMHILFLMPTFALMLLVGLWTLRRRPALAGVWFRAIGWKTGLTTLFMIAALFAPFLLYNYASTGRYYFFNDFKSDVFNLSASLQAWGQNLLIYLSQMILSPIADLNVWPVANDRQAFNTALNQIFNPLIAPFIDPDPRLYHMSYRFVGVTLPVSVRFVEFSLWSGFVWLLWPWQAGLTWRQKFPARILFFLLAITPPLWLLVWSFVTLYMEGTATYFMFYLICAAPASAMALTAIRRPFWNELRWVFVTLVVLSNLIISHNLVMYSGFRAIPDLFYARVWPYDWLLTDKRVIHEIRSASSLRISFTHEKLPYFGYMHWNPRAKYITPYEIKDPSAFPDLPQTLQILPISSLNMYGFMPMKVPGKATTGVTYLGTVRAIGREAIFAVGNGVEKRYPEESNYIVFSASLMPQTNGKWQLVFGQNPSGYSPEDHLTYEYKLEQAGQEVFHRPADANPTFTLMMDGNPHEAGLRLTIIIRSAWSGKALTQATYALGGPGAWLPEGGEY